jgi:hypothetical protein
VPKQSRTPSTGRRLDGRDERAPLSVLTVGTDDWAIEQSAAAIALAGHEVLRCHEPGEATFPCNALRPGRHCPLDVGAEAVVTSRARPTAVPAPEETGVICALHAGLPLIVTGISRNSPFTDYAVQVVAEQGDLIDALENATTERTARDRVESTPNVVTLPEVRDK